MIYQRYLHREYKEMEECESNKVTEEQEGHSFFGHQVRSFHHHCCLDLKDP